MGIIGGSNGREAVSEAYSFGASARTTALDVSAAEAVSWPSLLIDCLAILALGAITGTAYQFIASGSRGEPSVYAGTGLLVAVIFCGATRLSCSAHPIYAASGVARARMALTIWMFTFLLLAFLAFAMKIGQAFSRGAVLSFFAAGMPLVVATRVFVPRILARTLFANAYRGSEIIIAAPRGSTSLAHVSRDLRLRGCSGIHTIEFDGACDSVHWPAERHGLLRRVIDTARVIGPGEIYVLSGTMAQDRANSIAAGLRPVPRAIHVVPPETLASLFELPVRRIGPVVAVEMQKVPLSAAARTVKRLADLVVAGSTLVLLSPLLALIALAIKLDSDGPVFFLQRRNGYQGRQFRIVKFRTMTVLEDGDAIRQARRDDQRVTRIGRWLRKTSLDELPQLINILRGEMSLIGPRPHAVAHDAFYAKMIENYELRQHVKPGVTGWAQVNGLRGETPTMDLMFRRIEFDLWYAANASLMLDAQILVRTLFIFLRQNNAY